MSGSVVDLYDNSLGLSDFGCVQINAHVIDGKVISVMHQLAKKSDKDMQTLEWGCYWWYMNM